MSNRGIARVKAITLQFCDFGASSYGVRDLLKSDKIYNIANTNKAINFNFKLKRGYHPFIQVEFLNGYSKAIPLRQDDVTEAERKLTTACNEVGKRAIKHNGFRVISFNKSIQGTWKPGMFEQNPYHQMLHFPQFPSIDIERLAREKQIIRRDARVPKPHPTKNYTRSKHEYADM